MTDDEIVTVLATARIDETPPAGLEGQTLAALRAAGLVGAPKRQLRTPLRVTAAVAAMAACLALGIWVGVEHRRPSPTQSQFLLLLYEDAVFDARYHDQFPKLEAEYTAWIRSLARAGHAVDGEKLAWGGAELLPGQAPRLLPDVQDANTAHGYFIILADNEQAAIGVAETCPHLKYGGRIVLRPIVR